MPILLWWYKLIWLLSFITICVLIYSKIYINSVKYNFSTITNTDISNHRFTYFEEILREREKKRDCARERRER